MLTRLREQFLLFWKRQSRVQRITMIGLVATAAVLIPLFITWASTPTYAVAFSGLSEADAGQVVEKLTATGIKYQIRNGSTILVPTSKVYEVRLSMARAGLPQGGTVGYELFSGNTLGMTEFTQRVNYQRALEGELERTIASLSSIKAVRVHIVTPEKSLLSSEQASTTASVTIQEEPGQQVDANQVRAITHLVASSIEGMKPENVVVVDVNGNMLATGETTGDAATVAQTDEHRAVELLAGREIQKKVQDLLDQALGPNKSVVQTSVTLDWTQKESTTRSFNPDTSALRSATIVTESYTTTNGTLAGVPGAETNLPPAGTDLTAGNQSVDYLRAEKTLNYEITQVDSKEVIAPGNISRISLSVLVDGITDTVQLQTLQTVIAAAAGIDTTRGDTLAVESLAFDRSFYQSQAAELEKGNRMDLYVKIGEAVGAVLILAVLLWYVQRLLTNLRLASAQAWTPILKPLSELLLPEGGAAGAGGTTPAAMGAGAGMAQMPLSETSDFPSSLLQAAAEKIAERPLTRLDMPSGPSVEEQQLLDYLGSLVDDNPSSVAEIIQLWLSEDEHRNA